MTTIDTISAGDLDAAFREFSKIHDHATMVCPSCQILGRAMLESIESRTFEQVCLLTMREAASEQDLIQVARMALKAGLAVGMIAAEQARSKEVL